MYYDTSQQQGFIILYAVVISATVALMTAGIFGVAYRESVITSTATHSMQALYMADTGLECAFLVDIKQKKIKDGLGSTFSCDHALTQISVSYTDSAYRFSVPENRGGDGEQGCAHVFIKKGVDRTGYGKVTEITSRGFNVCKGGTTPNTNDPRLVERRFSAWYPE